jgi:hypothetical protein
MRDWTGAPWWYQPALLLITAAVVVPFCVAAIREWRRERDGDPTEQRDPEEP